MKCPLHRYPNGEFGECYKEDCAWWDEEYQVCAVLWLSKLPVSGYLDSIAKAVEAGNRG